MSAARRQSAIVGPPGGALGPARQERGGVVLFVSSCPLWAPVVPTTRVLAAMINVGHRGDDAAKC